MFQAQSALDTALALFDSGDFTKSLEYVDKVVLVFSPACSKVRHLLDFMYSNDCRSYHFLLFYDYSRAACKLTPWRWD